MWTTTFFLAFAVVYEVCAFRGLKIRTFIETNELGVARKYIQHIYNHSIDTKSLTDSHPFKTGMKPILVVVEGIQYEKIVGPAEATVDGIWFTEATTQFFDYMKKNLHEGHKSADIFLVGVYGLDQHEYENEIRKFTHPKFEDVVEVFGYGRYSQVPRKKHTLKNITDGIVPFKTYKDGELKKLLDRLIAAKQK